MIKNKKYEELIGQKISHLSIFGVEYYMHKIGGPYLWCLCDCGNVTLVKGKDLLKGRIHSCGCNEPEIIKPFIKIIKPKIIKPKIINPFKQISRKPPEIYEYPGKDFCVSFLPDGRSFHTFDKRDIPIVSKHAWSLTHDGYVKGHELVTRKDIRLHREIKKSHGEDIEGKVVDHKNGQIRDNRDENLRSCTISQNTINSKGYGKYEKYIDFIKDENKFRFRIREGQKEKVSERFDTYEEAQAYKRQWMAEHPNEFYYDEENNLSNIEYKLPEGAPIYDAFFIADGLKPPTTIKPFYEVPNKIITPFYEVPKRIITPFVMINQEPEDNKDSNIL